MNVPSSGWKNKDGTAARRCRCGSWKEHWIVVSGLNPPNDCSVLGCGNDASLGAHVIHEEVRGEWIILSCDACNQRSDVFQLKDEVVLVTATRRLSCGWGE